MDDEVDKRFIGAVSEYASTCDYCSELSMHESMIIHDETQLGLCENCQRKGITINVFNNYTIRNKS